MMMSGHKERLIKVNALIDEAVVPLVEALNELPRVLTGHSCQEHHGKAEVMFYLVAPERGAQAIFLRNLSRKIADINGDLAVCLSLEWFAGGDASMWIRVPTEQVDAAARAIRMVASERLDPAASPSPCPGCGRVLNWTYENGQWRVMHYHGRPPTPQQGSPLHTMACVAALRNGCRYQHQHQDQWVDCPGRPGVSDTDPQPGTEQKKIKQTT